MYRAGIQYLSIMDRQAVADSRFKEVVEIRISDMSGAHNESASANKSDDGASEGDILDRCDGFNVVSAVWNPVSDGELSAEVIERLHNAGVRCIVTETTGIESAEALRGYLDGVMPLIRSHELLIAIENSSVSVRNAYTYGAFSDAERLKTAVYALREAYGCDNIGICVDIGKANLLGINLKTIVSECADELLVMHINDNDGINDVAQMPFTFTTGRGERSTDFVRFVGVLCKIDFDGYIIFNTRGVWNRTPQPLHAGMTRLLEAIAAEWETIFIQRELLNQPGKKLILFGSGQMFVDYMATFGDSLKPEFVLDNNEEIWGIEYLGVPIKAPKDVLEIPPQERNVWICNMRYDVIGAQLTEMGVEYRCFSDKYFI